MKKFLSAMIVVLIVLNAGLYSTIFFVMKTDESQTSAGNKQTTIVEKIEDEATSVKKESVEKQTPVVTKATINAVGDVLIHSSVYKDAFIGRTNYDFTKMFSNIKKYITAADYAIANSETMIGGVELGLSDYPTFNSPKEVGTALKWSGFDAVTLANNHTIDRGEKGISAGLKNWDKIGLLKTGASRSEKERSELAIFEVNDIRFSLLSYTYGTNGIAIPKNKSYLVNVFDKKEMQKDIAIAQENSDVVIVAMHWGIEYEKMPNQNQKEWAKWLADQGVHIILGSHPHVLQPPAWVTGKNGQKTYVVYSMGNFISAQVGIDRLVGGIFNITVEKKIDGNKKNITLSKPTVIPIYNSYSNFRNYKLYTLKNTPKNLLPTRDSLYVKTKKHLQQYLGNQLIVK